MHEGFAGEPDFVWFKNGGSIWKITRLHSGDTGLSKNRLRMGTTVLMPPVEMDMIRCFYAGWQAVMD